MAIKSVQNVCTGCVVSVCSVKLRFVGYGKPSTRAKRACVWRFYIISRCRRALHAIIFALRTGVCVVHIYIVMFIYDYQAYILMFCSGMIADLCCHTSLYMYAFVQLWRDVYANNMRHMCVVERYGDVCYSMIVLEHSSDREVCMFVIETDVCSETRIIQSIR